MLCQGLPQQVDVIQPQDQLEAAPRPHPVGLTEEVDLSAGRCLAGDPQFGIDLDGAPVGRCLPVGQGLNRSHGDRPRRARRWCGLARQVHRPSRQVVIDNRIAPATDAGRHHLQGGVAADP